MKRFSIFVVALFVSISSWASSQTSLPTAIPQSDFGTYYNTGSSQVVSATNNVNTSVSSGCWFSSLDIGIQIALIFGLVQILASVFGYLSTRNLNTNSRLRADLDRFAREICLLKLERESLLDSLLKEYRLNPQNTGNVYDPSYIQKELRRQAIEYLEIPRPDVRPSDIDRYIDKAVSQEKMKKPLTLKYEKPKVNKNS